MRRIAAAALAAGLALAAAPARASESCEERFFPDRPGATNGHWVVGDGCLQLEAAASVTRSPGATALTFPALLRFGVHELVELRLDNGLIGIDIPDETSVHVGSTPLGLGVKLMGREAAGRIPGLGLLAGVRSPLGERFFDDMEPATALLFDWLLSPRWTLGLNAGIAAPVADDVHRVRFVRASAAAFLFFLAAEDWLGLYADGAGGVGLREGERWQQLVGGGVAFYPASNLQIDAGARVEVTGDAHPVTVELGVVWRL